LYVGPGTAYLSQIGYFPASLFTGLSSQATNARFGGCVKFINSLTSPPMGNGVFAKDNIPPGQPTPAMITDVNFIKPDGVWYPISTYEFRLDYLSCYGLGKFKIDGNRFVYGGPGGCSS
jgi:Neprosin